MPSSPVGGNHMFELFRESKGFYMTQTQHPSITPPDDPNTRIWHYMDFTKYVSMLEHGGLFFPRAYLLGDPFEGSLSYMTPLVRRMTLVEPFAALGWSSEEIKSTLDPMIEVRRLYQRWTMISCWHMNEYESVAMWKIYTKSNEALAVQFTFARLHESLDDEVQIGVVHYIDYERDDIPEGDPLTPFMYKRKSFEYEHELRAIIPRLPEPTPDEQEQVMSILRTAPPTPGEWKSVDLDQLIENVYIAPTAPDWFRQLVEDVLKRYGLAKPVIKSSLDSTPFF
jgi:hypothetical protein